MVITTMQNYQIRVLFYKVSRITSMSPKHIGSSITAKWNSVSQYKFIFETITMQITEKHFHNKSGLCVA
jgi:hypothetical protein